MLYKYIAYNLAGQIVRGKLNASDEEAANESLSFAGFRPISIKPNITFVNLGSLSDELFPVKPTDVILFYRQLAMLLKSGSNIALSLELLRQQVGNRTLKKVLGLAIAEVRSGNQLSASLNRYPKIFPSVYARLINIGEQSGDLETMLKQVADYMERELVTNKSVKGAMMMPGITAGIAVVVIGLMVIFILPSFGKLYTSMGAKLPPIALKLMDFSAWVTTNGLYVLIGLLAVVVAFVLYTRTPRGKYQLDKVMLSMPMFGRLRLLAELSRICRSISLLFRAGLPLTETMNQVILGSTSAVMVKALKDVHYDMQKGEGLSRPMSKNKIFLPMMVQMIRVGEETGSLDLTLLSVAETYETEAADKMKALVALIQPAMTIIIGLVIGVMAVALFSTIYGMTEAF